MWKRFVRAIKALFGKAVSAIEDPKLILEQNIREMNDQVPKMNQSIATVKANVMLLEKELKKYQSEHNDLMSKMKAAIKVGRDDIAANYAMRLESVRSLRTSISCVQYFGFSTLILLLYVLVEFFTALLISSLNFLASSSIHRLFIKAGCFHSF